MNAGQDLASPPSSLEFPKHILELPAWGLQLEGLKRLDLHGCANLKILPVAALLRITSLEELDCRGCFRLFSPPQEICDLGGKAVMEFLREVEKDGEFSKQMTLFLLGDGESGKTSVIKALKSSNSCAERIHEDSRTVGIDISSWEAGDVEFRILDLAGQAIYSKTHQLFLQKRALYLLVWRAHDSFISDSQTLQERIVHWIDSLQLRMPGAYIMLVVTHIDAVKQDILDELCHRVQSLIQQKILQLTAGTIDSKPILNFHRGAEFTSELPGRYWYRKPQTIFD